MTFKTTVMATPAKSIQAIDAETIVSMYRNMGIPDFGIKQNQALNFKYTGGDLEEGAQKLAGYLQLLIDCETGAIYTLCVYEDPKKGINERTPVDLSFNFRLFDQPRNYGSFDGAGYGQLLGEIGSLKKQLAELKQQPEESRLGLIGELMELEAMQPIMMAIGTRLADVIYPAAPAVGELKRVSGIPGLQPDPPTTEWRQDPVLCGAIDRLLPHVPDLGKLLTRLADQAENKPAKFRAQLGMWRTFL